MKAIVSRFGMAAAAIISVVGLWSCRVGVEPPQSKRAMRPAPPSVNSQVRSWSMGDLEFFYHGSMGNEVLPEVVLQTFASSYPDLFPNTNLTAFGLLPDRAGALPIGVSRRDVSHLAGLPSLGVNCAACHVADIYQSRGARPVRVLGTTSHFDGDAFFQAIATATYRTSETKPHRAFLANFLAVRDRSSGKEGRDLFDRAYDRQAKAILASLRSDPYGSKGIAPGQLHEIKPADLRITREMLRRGQDLLPLSLAVRRLFYNMRASLHLPHSPSSGKSFAGPGRGEAFGNLATLFPSSQRQAPVKYGSIWNAQARRWIQCDGNIQSPVDRNVLSALGTGTPLLGRSAPLEFANINRHTQLAQRIEPPNYPFSIDEVAAKRGFPLYQKHCASCHEGPTNDRRLHSLAELRTDPARALAITPSQANRYNRLLKTLSAPGYEPLSTPPMRSTQKYLAPNLDGVWARAPYLHNGAVRTLRDLLKTPSERPVRYRRGSRLYDEANMGYTDEGVFLFDTKRTASAKSGHAYGTGLSTAQKTDLIEYLKTR